MDGCFYNYFIIQFLTSSGYCIFGLSVISIEATFYVGIAVLGAMHMAAYCVMGTVVEHSVREIIESILFGSIEMIDDLIISLAQSNKIYVTLCNMKWYNLPVHQQRVFHYLLVHAQQSKVIYIADVKPLNMVTYLSVSVGFGLGWVLNTHTQITIIPRLHIVHSSSK